MFNLMSHLGCNTIHSRPCWIHAVLHCFGGRFVVLSKRRRIIFCNISVSIGILLSQLFALLHHLRSIPLTVLPGRTNILIRVIFKLLLSKESIRLGRHLRSSCSPNKRFMLRLAYMRGHFKIAIALGRAIMVIIKLLMRGHFSRGCSRQNRMRHILLMVMRRLWRVHQSLGLVIWIGRILRWLLTTWSVRMSLKHWLVVFV